MLVDMWDGATFSWGSERFEVRPIDVVPKPEQRPHPPLWLAGWSSTHARAAGRGGLGYLDVSGAEDAMLEVARDAYAEGRAECAPEDLVSVSVFAAVADLEPDAAGGERLAAWEEMSIDHAVLRAGPLSGGHEEAMRRIRALTDAAPEVH